MTCEQVNTRTHDIALVRESRNLWNCSLDKNDHDCHELCETCCTGVKIWTLHVAGFLKLIDNDNVLTSSKWVVVVISTLHALLNQGLRQSCSTWSMQLSMIRVWTACVCRIIHSTGTDRCSVTLLYVHIRLCDSSLYFIWVLVLTAILPYWSVPVLFCASAVQLSSLRLRVTPNCI